MTILQNTRICGRNFSLTKKGLHFYQKHAKVNPRCLVSTVDFSFSEMVIPNFPYNICFQLHMNYQEFLTTIRTQLLLRMEADVTLDIRSFTKNNGTHYDGLVLLHPKKNVSPAIYLMPYYHRYLEGVCLEEICEDILHTYQAHTPEENFDTSCFTDFSRASEHIVMRLVSFEKNQELLKEIPFFRYQDLAVIFYCLLHASTENQANILIHNHHLDLWKTDKEALCQLAHKNTPKLLPPQLTPMHSLLKEKALSPETPLPEAMPPLYILTNTYQTNGATVLLYDNLLKELSDLFEKDLIILPSSIHEVLILPADENDRKNLSHYTAMVKEVNASQLQDDEILSDHAYYYCRHSHLFTMPGPV